MTSGGPETEWNRILRTHLRSGSQSGGCLVDGSVLRESQGFYDAEMNLAHWGSFADLLQEISWRHWRIPVPVCQSGRQRHGDRARNSFSMTVSNQGRHFRLLDLSVEIIGEESSNRRDAHRGAVTERTAPLE